MKEALWGYLVLILGIFVVVVLLLTQNYSTTDEENYYLVKEAMEAAMLESVDLGTYRKDGTIRIVSEKFVENFTRRFAQSIKGFKTYKLDFYEIYESPPKATVKVSTSTGKYTIGEETANFEVITTLSGILEAKSLLKTDIEFDNDITPDGSNVRVTTYYEDGILKTTYYEDDIETTIYNQGTLQISEYCKPSIGYCYTTSEPISSSSSSGTGSSSGSRTESGNVNVYKLIKSYFATKFFDEIGCEAIKTENNHTYFYKCDAPLNSNLAYYLLYVPLEIKKNMPVIVWLHGSDEISISPKKYTDMSYTRYFSNILYSNKVNAFAILPVLATCKTGLNYREWTYVDSNTDVAGGIRTIVNQYKSGPLSIAMNFNKVSLAGHSLGGNGVIEIGATKNEDKFFYRLLALSTRMGSKNDKSFDDDFADKISRSGVPIMIYNEQNISNVTIESISDKCILKESEDYNDNFIRWIDHGDMPKSVFNNEENYHAISWLLGCIIKEKAVEEPEPKVPEEPEPEVPEVPIQPDTKPSFANSCNVSNVPNASYWNGKCDDCKTKYFSGNYNFDTHTSSINGKTFTIFKQDSEPWAHVDLVRSNGCYITSLSTILSGFYSDVTVCDFMFGNRGTSPNNNFTYANVDGNTLVDISAENIRKQLKQGNMLIFELQRGNNICGNSGQHHIPILDYYSWNDTVFIGDTIANSQCNGVRPLIAALKGVTKVYFIRPTFKSVIEP